jgi:hypothetical protein
MTGRILFVSDDVMFWARVRAAAQAASREIARIDGEAAMAEAYRSGDVARVLADVLSWARRWKSAPQPPELIAFGSHVDEGALLAAREAGFDRVMPNSQFHRTVAELVSS